MLRLAGTGQIFCSKINTFELVMEILLNCATVCKKLTRKPNSSWRNTQLLLANTRGNVPIY